MRTTILITIAIMLSGCLKDEPLNLSFTSYVPVEIQDGLVLSDPLAEGLDPEKLKAAYLTAYEDENLWPLRSLLVFRNNRLVSEAYLKDAGDITTQHLLWSSTKQVLGILAGIALQEELVPSLDASLGELLPTRLEDHPEKSGITFGQLLTMHSGIDFSNDGIHGETDLILRQKPDNITSFILSLPMRNLPGTDFHYNDGDPQLVAAVIQEAAGMPADQWADEVFFSRIGVRNYNWVRYRDGTTLGGFGIEITPRELGKIGMCVGENGSWDGEQVIPAEWVEDMTTVRVPATPFGYPFGYYWWLDPSREMKFTWGHGGQFVFVIPSRSLVVVMTSIPNTQGDYQVDPGEAMAVVDQVIGACLD